MRRMRRGFLIVAAAVVAAASCLVMDAPAPQADAATTDYGWSNCKQSARLNRGDIRVGNVDLSVDGWGDGVLNSFAGRAADATARWDVPLTAATSTGNGLTWVGSVSSTNTAHVGLRMETSAGEVTGDAWGVTIWGIDCAAHNNLPTVQLPTTIYVYFPKFSSWFTQDDSRRAFWEACPSSPWFSSYTCQKSRDFGSTVTHELGHALGLVHPSWAGGSAVAIAKCTNKMDQATMCPWNSVSPISAAYWRSHRRTLDPWDTTSLSYQY